MQRKYQSTTSLSWAEIQDGLGQLAGRIMAKRYIAFVTAADIKSNIPANILANLLQAEYHPQAIGQTPNNGASIVFSIDNHSIVAPAQVIQSNNYQRVDENSHLAGFACLYRYTYDDPAYNTLMTPEFYNEDIAVELDTRAKAIKYPWDL